ncbi:MAG: 30S ribosomal protein S9 [Candidatus Diapherotrites archaeon]|nr:30S ribosomal protein S9 [Candidatus Diapherotrites archaeon]
MEDEKKIKPAAKRAGMTVKAKKKTAVARAVIRKGKGTVKVNKMGINIYAKGYVRELVLEPIRLAGEAAKEFDIDVNVTGSGFMSQAVAVRSCIAKALAKAKGKKLKDLFTAYDRNLLVDDVRRVESKKPLGRKARKKKQHSKR